MLLGHQSCSSPTGLMNREETRGFYTEIMTGLLEMNEWMNELTSTCSHRLYFSHMSAISSMGSKAPSTVVPAVAFTMMGTAPWTHTRRVNDVSVLCTKLYVTMSLFRPQQVRWLPHLTFSGFYLLLQNRGNHFPSDKHTKQFCLTSNKWTSSWENETVSTAWVIFFSHTGSVSE